MFKHILIPTDGTELSEKAIRQGIAFAKSIGARVTAFHAAPRYHHVTLQEGAFKAVDLPMHREFDEQDKARAETFLEIARKAAREAGVPCESLVEINNFPHEAIIKAAQEKGCDLIFMASHGKSTISALLMGSETVEVLTHSSVPVLLWR
ncbi:MAG: hypothetical protein A3I00_06080 [Betaproteobacteria bacterium RIFCSPLOWO2_02_FULL_64_12]|nr:MAG: hypothetical protein A3I00_06080 [Betaproteobacteria bacterium RIFCSPLOWO2_02_FULL_64_12]